MTVGDRLIGSGACDLHHALRRLALVACVTALAAAARPARADGSSGPTKLPGLDLGGSGSSASNGNASGNTSGSDNGDQGAASGTPGQNGTSGTGADNALGGPGTAGVSNAAAAEAAAKSAGKAPKVPGDRVFTIGDRVKAVQRKLILKRGRFEIAPAFSLSLNDGFFQKVGAGLAGTYWLADDLGLFADVYYLDTFETSNVLLAKQAFTSTLLESRLNFLAAAGFQWSPIYGKVAWFNQDIIQYDLFLSAGFGMASTSTGNHVATTFGLGERYLVNRFLGIFFKVEDRLYPETYALKAGPVTTITNVLTLSIGVSIFFPMDFHYSRP